MTDDQTVRLKAISQQQESILVLGMIRIVDQAGLLIEKNRLCLLERDAMLYEARSSLGPIPGKLDIATSIILAIQAENT